MADCLFCKIVAGEIPCSLIWEDEDSIAFADIDPKAPVHFLVIPKTHWPSLEEADPVVVAKIMALIPRLAKEAGITKGYRVVTNRGEDGGQSVDHLHFHVLGGRALAWPPG